MKCRWVLNVMVLVICCALITPSSSIAAWWWQQGDINESTAKEIDNIHEKLKNLEERQQNTSKRLEELSVQVGNLNVAVQNLSTQLKPVTEVIKVGQDTKTAVGTLAYNNKAVIAIGVMAMIILTLTWLLFRKKRKAKQD